MSLPFSEQQLQVGCQQLGIALNAQQIEQLLIYAQLLLKWSTAYNLVSKNTLNEMLTLHLLDSIAIAPKITYNSAVDVGSGAGLPGLMLAVIFPQQQMTLLDSTLKRCRFMQHAVDTMQLSNTEVIHQRIEEWSPDTLPDAVICRAFASLYKIVQLTNHFMQKDTIVYAMKGRLPAEEITTIQNESMFITCERLDVPNLNAHRHLITIGSKNH